MGQPGQAHRDRVNKDHLIAGARELAHQVSLGMRVVIPPIFTTKADYRSIPQHRIYFVAFATHSPETPNGKFMCRSISRSAANSCPSRPLNADTLMLFSLSALTPVSCMSFLMVRIGRKNVMFA